MHTWKALSPALFIGIVGCADSQKLDSAATDAGGNPGPADSSIDGAGIGAVPDNCELAAQGHSSYGCETLVLQGNNMVNSSFPFSIVAANPTSGIAAVNVERGGAPIVSVNVPSHAARRIDVPWIAELKGSSWTSKDQPSVLLAKGAYSVSSSVPIATYQFSPLEFVRNGYLAASNDASLLLPTHALGTEYWVLTMETTHMNWGTKKWVNYAGYVSLAAPRDGTVVEVTSSAHLQSPGGGGWQLAPGDKRSFMLDSGDVLLLVSAGPPVEGESNVPHLPCAPAIGESCPTGPDRDLTGTHIHASEPVSVVSGHACALVPYDVAACDHLEESLLAVSAWGQEALVVGPLARNGSSDGQRVVRIISAQDDNLIAFDPPVRKPVLLNRGKWIELGPTGAQFQVKGTGKLQVAQFSIGEGLDPVPEGTGDPSMWMAHPTEQHRLDYEVFAPDTAEQNHLIVTAPLGTELTLDGAALSAKWQVIGSSGFAVARVLISGGAHRVSGDAPFGLVVYGYSNNGSFAYPGGLDTRPVVPR